MNNITTNDLEIIFTALNKFLDANKSNIKAIKEKEYITKEDIKSLMECSELEMKLRITIPKIEALINEIDTT